MLQIIQSFLLVRLYQLNYVTRCHLFLHFTSFYYLYLPSFCNLSDIKKKSKKKNTQTLRATKYSIDSTYSDLPSDLKVNRSRLALINRPWKCKKGKDRRSPLVHSRKVAEHDDFTHAFSRRYSDRGQRQENTDRAKNQSDCRIRYRALLEKINLVLSSTAELRTAVALQFNSQFNIYSSTAGLRTAVALQFDTQFNTYSPTAGLRDCGPRQHFSLTLSLIHIIDYGTADRGGTSV